MSNIIQKVKDAVHPHKDHTTGHSTTTTNTTGTGHTTGHSTTGHTTGHSTTGHSTTGHSTTGHTTTGNTTNTMDGIPSHNNPQSSNYGSHSSNLANKLDPTIDSDRDGRAAPGGVGNTHTTHTHDPLSGNTAHHVGDSGVGSHQAPLGASTHGTHGTTGSGLTGTHGTTGSGLTGTHGTTGSGLTGSHGTHGSSGLTGSHGTTGSGLTGTHGTPGHNSNLTTGSSATPGSGNAPNTAGVHDSDILNKLDPRVDSDLSGGKTYMGDKTFQ